MMCEEGDPYALELCDGLVDDAKFVLDPIGIAAGLRPKEANHGQKSDLYSNSVTKFTQNHVENHHQNRKRNVSALSKFSDDSMKAVFYAGMFLYGFWVLWGKDWLWDSRLCFVDFPFHVSFLGFGSGCEVDFGCKEEGGADLPKDIHWYFLVEMGFYVFLLESECFERKLNNVWVEFVHHTLTLVLLFLSTCIHGHRVGSIVLLLHNANPVFFLGEKAMKYLSKLNWSVAFFTSFAITFLITRIILFPYLILFPAVLEYLDRIPKTETGMSGGLLIVVLLFLLFVFQLYRMYLILVVVSDLFAKGDFKSVVGGLKGKVVYLQETVSQASEGENHHLALLIKKWCMYWILLAC
ncbi:unnamed protein product [Darwinula stevensoni]|uniref:TLC domain-containing protein n=1 Tax=Darwinula stevensoni TaxID=69355 RepID=A0A7R8XE52_9CRUS|nr:unnamed protein product [Darwinula stevensoni]CAG0894969.1 unnamed protein product [Darwinula stevensoni]